MDKLLEEILGELQVLRKLKMIELMEAGYSQSKLAKGLAVSQSTISRMINTPKQNRVQDE